MVKKSRFLLWQLIPAIVLVFLYKMALIGMVPLANDTISHKPIAHWINQYAADNDGYPFWYPHLFSGMPAFGSHINTPGDPTRALLSFLLINRGLKYWFHFVLGGLGVFFILRRKKIGPVPALFGGLIFSLTPYLFGLVNAGHSSKIFALCYVPWVFAAADYCFHSVRWRGILLLGLASALQLWANHPQIVYYTWMVILLWWSWTQISLIINKKWRINTGGIQTIFILGSLLVAFLLVSTPYVFIYEFQQQSNRGAPSVLDSTNETESGTKWDYATQWSFQPRETVSFLYPYFYGLQNFPTRDIKGAAYWGGMPFTQSTHYIGLLVILISILGALLKKPDKFQTFLWVTSALILLVGFGKYIPILFGPLFYWAPFFSKFRTPSMIYALLPFTFSLLAAFGLQIILDFLTDGSKEKLVRVTQRTVWIFGSFIAVTLVLLLFGNALVSFIKPGELSKYGAQAIGQIKQVRSELFQKGMLLAFFLSVSGGASIWLVAKRKLSIKLFGWIIIILTLIDLWTVDNEFLYLKNPSSMNRQFKPNKITQFLNKDQDYFRIYPRDDFGTNWYGYFGISSVGGYRPVKLRTYQDLMDAGGLNRLPILNMLNVKYLITKKNIQHPNFVPVLRSTQNVYLNESVLPKAWIVNKIKTVKSQKTSLNQILDQEFEPGKQAVVVSDTDIIVDSTADGSVNIANYSENEIILKVKIHGQGFLVLSENYYPPGWRASIDGGETKIYQTNHILRGIIVPDGEHDIRFWYDSGTFTIVKIISRASFIIVLLLLAYSYHRPILQWMKKRKDNHAVA
ncbi:MAG: YfhO family protein [FCB group bacterium]|nr:YfhO family protein [FCB group bacterium]